MGMRVYLLVVQESLGREKATSGKWAWYDTARSLK